MRASGLFWHNALAVYIVDAGRRGQASLDEERCFHRFYSVIQLFLLCCWIKHNFGCVTEGLNGWHDMFVVILMRKKTGTFVHMC